ncbi:hypothetical protein GL286_18765 [Paracoccus aestuariivivens]|uniref:GHMP kinase N-terminal domain-containing protein n=1 Tax=Paracoccus aestuariivivens TaxID=1820333 RepID=A0A6L6JF05_9RHOB|nr:hypothetical protein [Paracoccus aestuariivivens]
MLTDQGIEQLFCRLPLKTGSYSLTAEMPPGGGAGASTAALVALARAAGLCSNDHEQLVQVCLTIEGASDPLALPEPDALLWASRQGEVVDHLPPPPMAEIVGGFWGDPLRTDPLDLSFADVTDLVREWRNGPDIGCAAKIASQSALRCTALRGPFDDPTADLARELGALGHVRAHTGSARGLIFRPGEALPDTEAKLQAAGFTRTLRFRTGERA